MKETKCNIEKKYKIITLHCTALHCTSFPFFSLNFHVKISAVRWGSALISNVFICVGSMDGWKDGQLVRDPLFFFSFFSIVKNGQ